MLLRWEVIARSCSRRSASRYRCNPVKGYSVTLPLEPVTRPVHEPDRSRAQDRDLATGDRLRVAGTAELNGYDTEMNEPRWRGARQALLRMVSGTRASGARSVLDGTATGNTQQSSRHWTFEVLEPFSQHRARHLGWTLACGSGRALADIVSGRNRSPSSVSSGSRPKRKGQPSRPPRTQRADARVYFNAARGPLFRRPRAWAWVRLRQ